MLTSRWGDDLLTKSWKRNKRTDNLARSPKKSKRIYNAAEATKLLISDSWSELSDKVASNLSKSVVSLALSNGHTMLFSCSGVAVERAGNVTRFLTSASLVRALNDNKEDHDNLKIEVRHEDNVVTGFLGEYDFHHNIAVVNVKTFTDVHYKLFNNPVDFQPYTKVVALGRGISGKLMVTSGILTSDSSESAEELNLSTCKVPPVCEGGPLFDFDGNFVGMNIFFVKEGTIFMPMMIVLDHLSKFTSPREIRFPIRLNLCKAVRVGERLKVQLPDFYEESEAHKNVLHEDQFGDLESLGYPKPSMVNDGMVLVNTFEEPFGDLFGKGVWGELSETTFSNICGNIVALASFNGKKRMYACTGYFIDWNGCPAILTSASLVTNSDYGIKIHENLRIEVLLPSQQHGEPNKQRREGTLLHYNLHHNVALVSVRDFHASHPAKIQHVRGYDSCDLVAVGCCFKSGRLMAARGEMTSRFSTLDCKFLSYSTCKISKVGIGGPLLDLDGRFIGVSFYEKNKGTPFLQWKRILALLEHFKTKRTVAEVGHAGYPSHVGWTIAGDCSFRQNRWPVPVPYWCDPVKLYPKHETESDTEEGPMART